MEDHQPVGGLSGMGKLAGYKYTHHEIACPRSHHGTHGGSAYLVGSALNIRTLPPLVRSQEQLAD